MKPKYFGRKLAKAIITQETGKGIDEKMLQIVLLIVAKKICSN
jgi:hypothetical protein